jgi:mono/diheme cytochrome c family protein
MVERPDQAELNASTNRWMWAGLVLMVLFFMAFPVYRVFEPSARADARAEQSAFLADRGGEIYGTSCSDCHGTEGRGALGPAIGSREFLEAVDDRQISQLIALGVPGTPMVSYSIDFGGPMTSAEINAVTAYLRSLEENAPSNPLWRTPLADTALTGEDLYLLACAQCHGADRMGIQGDGPNISPGSFAMEESDEWLAERIRNGKNEMPRWGGVLTDDQIASIVAFLRGETPTTDSTVPATDSGGAAQLELGKQVFEVTAGGRGCADCHGFDAQGTIDGPNILGSSKSAIADALGGGVPEMRDIELTPEELDAVYRYLQTLS